MEFKFRAGDPRSPPPPLQCASSVPPAGFCFSKQGFPDACLGRTTNVITLRKPFDTSEAMHCEMELMRLREEKLLLEIERQRFLKEEARKELMLIEREIAIRDVAQSVGYSLRQPQRWGVPFIAAAAPSLSPSPAVVVQSFQEWQKMEKAKSSECLGFGAVALPPRVQPFTAEDKRDRQVLQADESKLVVLAKPDPNVFREKLKAEMPSTSTDNLLSSCVKKTPTSTDNLQSSGVKKTPKDEWSCALCEVRVLNERAFNEHLHGKKHKRREAVLRAQKACKVSQAAPPEPLSNKRRKLEKTFGSAGAKELKKSKDEETLQGEKTEGSFVMNALIPNFLESGDKEDKKQQNLQNKNLENLLKSDEKEDDKQQNQNQNLRNFLKSDDKEDNRQQSLQNFLKSGEKEDNKQQNLQNQNQNLQNILKSGDKEDNKQQNLQIQNQNLQNFLKSGEKEDNKQQNLQNQNQNLQNIMKSGDKEDNKQQNLQNQNQNLQNFLKSGEKEDNKQQNLQNFLKSGDKEDNKQQNQIMFWQNFTAEDLLAAKKKFNYWCKKCRVGAYAADVMVAHLNGKKHKANLQEPDQTATGKPL